MYRKFGTKPFWRRHAAILAVLALGASILVGTLGIQSATAAGTAQCTQGGASIDANSATRFKVTWSCTTVAEAGVWTPPDATNAVEFGHVDAGAKVNVLCYSSLYSGNPATRARNGGYSYFLIQPSIESQPFGDTDKYKAAPGQEVRFNSENATGWMSGAALGLKAADVTFADATGKQVTECNTNENKPMQGVPLSKRPAPTSTSSGDKSTSTTGNTTGCKQQQDQWLLVANTTDLHPTDYVCTTAKETINARTTNDVTEPDTLGIRPINGKLIAVCLKHVGDTSGSMFTTRVLTQVGVASPGNTVPMAWVDGADFNEFKSSDGSLGTVPECAGTPAQYTAAAAPAGGGTQSGDRSKTGGKPQPTATTCTSNGAQLETNPSLRGGSFNHTNSWMCNLADEVAPLYTDLTSSTQIGELDKSASKDGTAWVICYTTAGNTTWLRTQGDKPSGAAAADYKTKFGGWGWIKADTMTQFKNNTDPKSTKVDECKQ